VNRITLVQRGSGANDGSGAAAGEQSAEAAKQSTIASNELYEAKLKGMSRVLQLVSHSLSGGYANFGVMALYNDASLKLCIKGVLQLVMSVRFSEIINFPKVATNYFTLLEILFKSHVELVTELCDAAKFLALVSSLHEGLLSVQTVQQQHAALAIEHLVKWHYQQRNAKPGSVEAVARARLDQYIAQSSTLLPEILCTLFNLVRSQHTCAFVAERRCMVCGL
jgi:exportin-7